MIKLRLATRMTLAVFPLLVALIADSAIAESNPNIVIFLVDDMGVMDTSLPFLTDETGNPKRYPLNDYYRTPNMRRLASAGIRFNNFYAMSVCSPTRISIMTGQNAARHHATNWINPRNNNRGPHGPPDWDWEGLRSSDVTLPGLLAANGYETIHVGKGHFGCENSEGAEPLNLGFDFNIGGASFGAPGSYYAEENYGAGTKRAHHAVPHLDKYHGGNTFLTEALTRETKARLDQTVGTGKPFFLYMAHYAVHAPFHSDPRFAKNYSATDQPENAKAFATLIEGMDQSLGDLLDHLNDLGVAENTLVFFLGDNGSDAPLGHEHAVACAAPLRGKKGSHYEGGMRVPLIAAWAKRDENNVHQMKLPVAAGAIQPQVASVTDLFPTIGKLVGIQVPPGHDVDGRDLSRLLTGVRDDSREQSFLMHYPHAPHRSTYFTCLRMGDWKVIYHFIPSDDSDGLRYQLFNLAEDPFESTNLANREPQKLAEMMLALSERLESHNAQYPVIDEDGSKPMKVEIPSPN